MLEMLFHIMAVDTFTFWVCAVLTFGACAILSSMTGSLGLALSFLPAISFGGFATVYALSQAGVILVPQKDANVILSCSAGMLAGILLMILITRTILAATEVRDPVTKPTGDQQS